MPVHLSVGVAAARRKGITPEEVGSSTVKLLEYVVSGLSWGLSVDGVSRLHEHDRVVQPTGALLQLFTGKIRRVDEVNEQRGHFLMATEILQR